MAPSGVLGAIVALAAAFPVAAAAATAGIQEQLSDIAAEYDYIVVGGGTSGLVVANRLSADPNTTVLVVEYGDVDTSFEATVPGMVRSIRGGNTMSYQSLPQSGLMNSTQGVTVGAVVGGGSQVNGMTFNRGSRSDYDAWEELGNPGWGWESMFKYFKKSTTFTPPKPEVQEKYRYVSDPNTYGTDGPIQVGFPSWQWPDAYLFRDAWINDIGLQNLTDHGAGGNNVGCAWVPTNIDPVNATRSTSRTGYYDPVKGRANLQLLVRHYVSTVVLGNGTAVGVNIVSRADKGIATVRSRREVVLAAGAIQTPRILQLSGIGPAGLLKSLGIEVVQDLPGVGANFQDHPNIGVRYSFGNVSDVAQSLLNSQSYYNSALEEYRVNRTGPMTMATASNMVFLSLRELSPTNYTAIATSATNQQAELFLPATYTAHPELLAGFLTQRSILAQHFLRPDAGIVEMPFGAAPYQGGAVAIQRPLSRGTVMITSNDSLVDPGRSSPAIDFGALMNPLDAQIGVLAVRAIRRLFSNETVLGQVRQPVEVAPTARAETDEQLEAVLRRAASASWAHPCCTAHMAPRELGGVIDAKLRVYGVTGLRVVDASVMPTIPGGHLQSTVYAVAEKAADILLGRG